MNTYTYAEIEVGDEEHFACEITDTMMQKFREITGDINPLHNDLGFAVKSGYKDRIVYGMLSASLLSTLAGVYLPGKFSLINSVEVWFAKPVYIGERLTVSGKVYKKDDKYNLITLKVTITNQLREKVCRGRMEITVKQ